MYLKTSSNSKTIKIPINKKEQMSHQQNQQNKRIYEDCQDHLYETHVALQELTTYIGSFHNSLIKLSSALLYAHTYTSNESHTKKS